ncbi:MAG: sigma-54-dependent Fis family transcriptional regulator [Opitutales bacterium]|nr:sigma-54-dependent Fis family transcriptional regulator [Opitutales bacterium]
MAFEKIIVLDDEMIIRKSLEQQLRKKHYSVATASKISEAEALLSKDQFDLMFVDVRLPDGDGTELLERVSEDPNGPLVVIITGYGSIESAVECMRKGAFDYIVKPCSMDEIDVILKKAESYSQLLKVNQYFSNEQANGSEIVGNSPKLKHLRTLLKKVAATDATVLVSGENGTGKELIAGELYRLSPRSGKPFIKVNCAAMSETLMESEFFGHEKGSFTGAAQRREGRFELAHNGTILLDEIGEIPLRLQAKLLRVLQEREFERVGGNRTISVDVRVIATTNRDLMKEVREGRFREDLFYRLNVFPIVSPPLRERKEDIPLLANTFLERMTRRHGVKIPGFSKEAMEMLVAHQWPGNVRELQNTIERCVILAEPGKPAGTDALGLFMPVHSSATFSQPVSPIPIFSEAVEAPEEDIPAAPSASPAEAAPPSLPSNDDSGEFKTLDELEKDYIMKALDFTGGKRVEAAALLNISTRTLRNKINQYRLDGEYIP